MVDAGKQSSKAVVKYDKETAPHFRPSRVGLKTIVTYVPPEMSKALRILAIQQDLTMQSVGEQAFELYLQHHGVKVKKPK